MILLVSALKAGLPYRRISVRCPSGNTDMSVDRVVAMLLSRVCRGDMNLGQRRKKCSVDSISTEQRQVGLVQLKL